MLFAMIAILFGAALLICAMKVHKSGQQLSLIKPEWAPSGIAVGALFFALGFGILGANANGPRPGDPISDVMLTIPNSDSAVISYQSAPLADGVAVVVNDFAGYWVKDGKAYAVNGVAKGLSPDISYAPTDIDWRKVELAIE